MSAAPTSPASPLAPPTSPANRSKGWNPSPWSLLCLVVGVVLLCVHFGFIFISAPLFLASFVLSIIAMARHRVVSGVFMMIAVFTVPPVITLGVLAHSVSSGIASVQKEKAEALANLSFEQVSGYRDGGYMYLKGYVRNNGTAAVDFVKVVVDWTDKNGTVLDTTSTYVTSFDKLEPGAAKSFSIMTPSSSEMSNYRYRFSSD